MENIKLLLLTVSTLLLLFAAGCGGVNYTTSNYNEGRNTFSELDLYGQWINVPSLGDVWKPNAGYDYRPYEAGQWELTDKGWMWFSDEPYGWIVYHYGNWAFTGADGWVWVPGYDWSPSRVRWIMQNDYIGWAPLPPAGWNIPSAYDNNGSNVWIIVPSRDFDNSEIYKYRVPINSIRNNRSWDNNRSPDQEYIRNATGRNIAPVNIQTENVRGGIRNLTRVRMIDRNRQNNIPPQNRNDQNNYTPPTTVRNQPQQPAAPNNESKNGGRKVNTPPQNVQPPKTRGGKVEPKRPDEKNKVRTNAPDRNSNGRKTVGQPESRPAEIKKADNSKTKTRVIETPKKQLKKTDLKKQKTKKDNIKPKDEKKKAAKKDNSLNGGK